MATETKPQLASVGGSIPTPVSLLGPVESTGLRLLGCTALALAFICLLILPSGPHESDETLSWVLAFGLAIPLGFFLVARQERQLAAAAPAASARGVAAGVVIMALAFMLRRIGSGERPEHAILLVAALAALLAPFAAARIWHDPEDRDTLPARVIAAIWLVGTGAIFVPSHALRAANLIPALVLTGLVVLLLIRLPRRGLQGRRRLALDFGLCAVIFLAVIQLPVLTPELDVSFLYHQGFFVGPANDVLHGRAMLGGAWSQYGVGLIDSLALVFTVLPFGFGTLMLIITTLTALQYVCVYATLRLAGLGQVLVVLTLVAAGAGNLFSPLGYYLLYPSAGPLRFGLPYLIVLAAVIGARYPARTRATRVAILALLAIGAPWSFETFVYCGVTYGCLVLVEALAAGSGVVRRVAREAAVGLTVCIASLLVFSLVTLALDGRLRWDPYLEYLRLYTEGELGALPVVVFSAGPLMAATIFFSGVSLLWLVWRKAAMIEPPLRAALAGFIGIGLGLFTYYLGRSHPNNLLVIMVPAIVVTGIWMHILLRARPTLWRTAAISLLVLGWSMVAVASWPSVKEKAQYTALGLAIPGSGHSLRLQIDSFRGNPPFNPLAPIGVEMLAKRLPPEAPALVLTQQDLTTELLMRADRRNLLPISHPPEDVLIKSSFGRVRSSAEDVPAGTLMLTSPPYPPGSVSPLGFPIEFNELQKTALGVLHRRFDFRVLEVRHNPGWPERLEMVRLVPKAQD